MNTPAASGSRSGGCRVFPDDERLKFGFPSRRRPGGNSAQRGIFGRCVRWPDERSSAGRNRHTGRMGADPIRSAMDCLIAGVAIRGGVPVRHGDRDYRAIAEDTPLRAIESL